MTTDKFPKRKHPRLKHFDYSQNGCYHIVICTKEKECLLGKVIFNQQADDVVKIHLSPYGIVADNYLQKIGSFYEYIKVDKYVVMPNHIHLLLTIEQPFEKAIAKTNVQASVFTVIKAFKRMVTKDIGRSIWQESFYDNIIETAEAYYNACEYIENNPVNWIADKYYSKQEADQVK